MKLTPVQNGGNHTFGKLAHIRGQVWYTLSQNEQSPFAGFFKKGFPSFARRFLQELPYVAPPLLLTYAIFVHTKNESVRMGRKQPGQFDNE